MMEITRRKSIILTTLYDLTAILVIYLIPAFSHLVSYPLYLFDPMRIVLFISIAHFRKQNAYFIALSLPLFSFLLSGHPLLPKMMIMTAELTLNVYLFFLIKKLIGYNFLSAFLSIIVSKCAYYLMKYGLIRMAFLEGDLISTPPHYQLIVSILMSFYIMIFLQKKQNKSEETI